MLPDFLNQINGNDGAYIPNQQPVTQAEGGFFGGVTDFLGSVANIYSQIEGMRLAERMQVAELEQIAEQNTVDHPNNTGAVPADPRFQQLPTAGLTGRMNPMLLIGGGVGLLLLVVLLVRK